MRPSTRRDIDPNDRTFRTVGDGIGHQVAERIVQLRMIASDDFGVRTR